MAGPALEILLWQPFSADRAQLLRDLVVAVTCSLDDDPLQVFTTRPFGGSYDGNPSLPFPSSSSPKTSTVNATT